MESYLKANPDEFQKIKNATANAIVEYNAFSDFMGMAGAEGYPSYLREPALLDSRLIHCQSIQH